MRKKNKQNMLQTTHVKERVCYQVGHEGLRKGLVKILCLFQHFTVFNIYLYIIPVGITCTPKTAKRIRICTAADLRRTCPPKPEKPKIICPPPPTNAFRSFLGLGLKCGFAGALVYGSWAIGLWGDPTETEQIWVSMRNSILGDDCPDRFAEIEGCPHESVSFRIFYYRKCQIYNFWTKFR